MIEIRHLLSIYIDKKTDGEAVESVVEHLADWVYRDFIRAFYLNSQINQTDGTNPITIISGAEIVMPCGQLKKLNLALYKDKILGLSDQLVDKPEGADSIKLIDGSGKILSAGLIDQHIHGGYGIDFNLATEEQIHYFCSKLPEHGVTSFLPTVMTDSEKNIKNKLELISSIKSTQNSTHSKILGMHLEGPFLSPKHKGIHPENDILLPSIGNYKKIENENIKIVTYAPDLDEKLSFTKFLTDNKIIPSAGHSGASCDLVEEAQKAGLKQVTHLFNAMSPIHHRTPGITTEALINDSIYTEVIADGMHLHHKIIGLILKTKPLDKILFISDSLPINRHSEDSLLFGGQKIYRKDNKAVNAEGTFAGSTMFLDDIIRYNSTLGYTNVGSIYNFATKNIAENLRLNNIGTIKAENTADIVLWNKTDMTVSSTFINGQMVYQQTL